MDVSGVVYMELLVELLSGQKLLLARLLRAKLRRYPCHSILTLRAPLVLVRCSIAQFT